jgi:hypothetical protein
VVEGHRLAWEVGGGKLGRLLRHLSDYLRVEQRSRSEPEVLQAWAVNAASAGCAVALWSTLTRHLGVKFGAVARVSSAERCTTGAKDVAPHPREQAAPKAEVARKPAWKSVPGAELPVSRTATKPGS